MSTHEFSNDEMEPQYSDHEGPCSPRPKGSTSSQRKSKSSSSSSSKDKKSPSWWNSTWRDSGSANPRGKPGELVMVRSKDGKIKVEVREEKKKKKKKKGEGKEGNEGGEGEQ